MENKGFTVVELVIIVAIAGILAAIAIPPFCNYQNRSIKSGVVVDKVYTPAHHTTTMILVGKVMVPNTIYYPDSWKLVIRGERDDGDFKQRYVSVPEGEYMKIGYGDNWNE